MFTKHWYQAIIAHAMKTTPVFRNMSGNIVSWNSYQLEVATRIGYSSNSYGVPSMYNVRTSLGTYGGVIFGDGNAPPTLDDYNLSGNLITSVNATASVKHVNNNALGAKEIRAEYTLTNTGTSSITIREIGLIAAAGGNNSQSNMKCLLERTVLDEPVTIPRGGSAVIAYTIRMYDPTYTSRWDLP